MSLPDSYLLSIETWRAETARMHHKWQGPYLNLCLSIFLAGGSVPNVPLDLAFKARLTAKQFDVFWPAVKGHFLVSDSEVRHAVSSENRAKWNEFVTKRREIGAKGGKKTQEKQRAAKAAAKAIGEDRTLRGPPIGPPLESGTEGLRLTAADEDLFYTLTGRVVTSSLEDQGSLSAVRSALASYDPASKTFECLEPCRADRDWNLIRSTLSGQGYRLRLSEQRVFDLGAFRRERADGT
ncbi:MAG: hypothetical protein KDA53_12630 [Hyphomonas sp.]|nr:hypothetical protein [Hyphomonas sp.]